VGGREGRKEVKTVARLVSSLVTYTLHAFTCLRIWLKHVAYSGFYKTCTPGFPPIFMKIMPKFGPYIRVIPVKETLQSTPARGFWTLTTTKKKKKHDDRPKTRWVTKFWCSSRTLGCRENSWYQNIRIPVYSHHPLSEMLQINMSSR
jgi:hypothetical protein